MRKASSAIGVCAVAASAWALMHRLKGEEGGTNARPHRVFALLAAAVLLISSSFGVAVYWLSTGPSQALVPLGGGGMPVIPGWEPWYFYADGKVNAGSGNLYLNFTDIRVRARGFTLEVVRAYNSQSASTDSDFGYGWTWNYGTRLVEDASGDVTWYDGDGSEHQYTFENVTGDYTPPVGIHSRLTEDDGNFTLWHLDGSRWLFVDGLPSVWTDKNGNNLTFTWADPTPLTGPELEKVEDDSGLSLEFTYSSGRITSVEDPLARTVFYTYDRSGNLDKVTDPLDNDDKFDYDSYHVMTRWIDRADVLYEFDHDSYDRLVDLDVSLYDAIDDGPLAGSTIDKMNVSYVSAGGASYSNITNDRGYTGSVKTDQDGLPEVIETPVTCVCGALSICMRLASLSAAKAGCGASAGCGGGCADGCPLNGDSYTLTWDADYNLERMEDALDNEFNYTYNDYGQVETSEDPLGNTATWEWDVTDGDTEYISLLSNFTNARTYTWHYDYDADGNLINMTDPLDNFSTLGYGDYGYMTSLVDFRGNEWTYDYDTHGYLLNITDPTGNVTTYGWDGVGRMVNMTNARGYTTSLGWDDGDRLLNVTDALGGKIEHTYNGRGDRLSITDALGRETAYEWNLTVGKVASIADARGNTTYHDYDGEGNLVKLTNARGYATEYKYDSSNRLTDVTDARGNTTSYENDDAGRLIKFTDRRGTETTYGYDAAGRKVNVTDALGNTTYFAYDEVGNLVNITNARGYSTLYTYDALNRLTKIEDALGGITNYSYDENWNFIEIEDPNGHTTSFAYDELNRRTSVTDPLDHSMLFEYDEVGNSISIEDANGMVTQYDYDELNRLVTITDALDRTTSFGYDAVGNIVNITDANNHTTTQTWDELNRLVEVVSPLGNKTAYEYDEMGNTIRRMDPKCQQTNYTYDELNRLIRIDYPDGTNVTVEYDEEGNAIYAEGWGFSRTDEYDLLGRVEKTEFDFGPFNKTISYTYDEAGNRLTMVDGENETTTYEWDELDRLTAMTAPNNLTFLFDYDAASRRTKLTYPDDMYTNYTYDDANWITLMESKAANHTLFESFAYGYDALGNKVNVTYENSTAVEYSYDDVYRLVSEDYSWSFTINYTYDGAGNRLTETRNGVATNYTYDAENHLLSRGNTTYEWDDNGNLVKKREWNGNTTYEWDYENRLTKVTLPNGTTLENEYDATGMRISESMDHETTYLFYDFRDLTHHFEDLTAEYNSTGARMALFVHGPGIDEPLAVTRGETTNYYLHDALGSVTGLATASDVSAAYRYEAFGTIHPGFDKFDRYGFTSREVDPVSSIYYYRARWYDTQLGRFLGKDPAGFADGPNLYAYVGDNPANRMDPSGKGCWLGGRWCWVRTTSYSIDWAYFSACMGVPLQSLTVGIFVCLGACVVVCKIPILNKLCSLCAQGCAFGALVGLGTSIGVCLWNSIRTSTTWERRYICWPEAAWLCTL